MKNPVQDRRGDDWVREDVPPLAEAAIAGEDDAAPLIPPGDELEKEVGAMRAHLVLPEDLVEAVDSVAGKRKRSQFVEEAVREKLAREMLGVALRESAGSIQPSDYPEWETPEKTSAWVRSIRGGDEAPLPVSAAIPQGSHQHTG